MNELANISYLAGGSLKKPSFLIMQLTRGLILFFICFAVAPCAIADIYMTIDANGVMHFTNMPVSPGSRVYIRESFKSPDTIFAPERFDTYITAAAKKHGIAFPLVKAIIKVESDFNPRAVSSKGAKGLMQIMPQNYDALRISDPFDPRENIMGGTSYLKQLLVKYNGKLSMALAAYNAGPNAVDRYNRIPPYPETRNYVKQVLKYYRVFLGRTS